MQFPKNVKDLFKGIKKNNGKRTGSSTALGIKQHKDIVFAVFAALVLSALMAVFILAFRRGVLPFSADGDAFDTIYALEQSEEVAETEEISE